MQIYKGEFSLLDVLGFEFVEELDIYMLQLHNGYFLDIHKDTRHISFYCSTESQKCFKLGILIELVSMGLVFEEMN